MSRSTGWFVSSHSSGASNNCVEVRFAARGVDVRDSTRRPAGMQHASGLAWRAFVTAVRAGRV